MAGGFWAPYASQQDASTRICNFANHQFGLACGVTWSDGHSVAVLRHAQVASGGHGVYVNVLRQHISAPPPPPRPAPPATFVQRAEAFFWRAMEIEGESEMANAEAQRAGSQALFNAVRDDVWEPAHRFMLGHKTATDGASVVIDAIGVFAGIAFVIALSPEIGALAIVTGVAAAVGSGVLLLADGAVFATEATGHKDLSEQIESSPVVQWSRIVGTVMTLIDIPVGGVRALIEVGRLGGEARAALAGARETDGLAEAARARLAKIHHPERHPGPVSRRLRRVKTLTRQADAQRLDAEQLARKRNWVRGRDVTATFAATPAGTAAIIASPPKIALTPAQQKSDADYLKLLEPEHGMPKDTKLELRTSAVGKVSKP